MSTRFTALTVRYGDAFLLEDDGWNCLFDSGDNESIVDLLEYKGIKKLDLAICSHNDVDHAGGFIELLDSSIQIEEIWLPGLWASVILFVKENGMNRGDVEWGDGFFNGELDSLFSDESESEDSFNRGLSFLGELENSKQLDKIKHRIHRDLLHRIMENPRLFFRLYQEYRVIFPEVIQDNYEMRRFPHPHASSSWDRRLEEFQLEFAYHLDIKLDNIMRIAGLARRKCHKIRWFEPSSACTKERIDYGFVSLNSSRMCSIRMPKNGMAYMNLLYLSRVNKYSLVFDYTKNDVPIIRFSADSDSTCQSVNPYPKSIIVTAPHHGSKANAKVYHAINGNDLIWVRSDWTSSDRPCDEFKAQKSKYCLACHKYNFVSEICFEYNPVLGKWDYVHGEQCRCKVLTNDD